MIWVEAVGIRVGTFLGRGSLSFGVRSLVGFCCFCRIFFWRLDCGLWGLILFFGLFQSDVIWSFRSCGVWLVRKGVFIFSFLFWWSVGVAIGP